MSGFHFGALRALLPILVLRGCLSNVTMVVIEKRLQMSSGLGSRKPQIRYSSISDQHTLPLVGLHIGRIGCLLPIVVNVLAEMSRSAKDTAEVFVTRQAVPDQSAV